MRQCGLCGGVLILMGRLGLKDWYRCRNCGMTICRESKRKPKTWRFRTTKRSA